MSYDATLGYKRFSRSEGIQTNTDILNLLYDHDFEHSNPTIQYYVFT